MTTYNSNEERKSDKWSTSKREIHLSQKVELKYSLSVSHKQKNNWNQNMKRHMALVQRRPRNLSFWSIYFSLHSTVFSQWYLNSTIIKTTAFAEDTGQAGQMCTSQSACSVTPKEPGVQPLPHLPKVTHVSRQSKLQRSPEALPS